MVNQKQFVFAVVVGTLVVVAIVYSLVSRPVRITVRVLDDGMGPIEEAQVFVQGGVTDSPSSPVPSRSITDKSGQVTVETKPRNVVVRVWKSGYIESALDFPLVLPGSEAIVVLDRTNCESPIPEFDEIHDFDQEIGFSFSSHGMLPKNHPAVDLIVSPVPTDPTSVIVSSSSAGAIVFQKGTIDDFKRSSVAPEIMPTTSVRYNSEDKGFFFIRNADGTYSKFRLLPNRIAVQDGGAQLSTANMRLIWAHQADGSRTVCTSGSPQYPFPFDRAQTE